MTHPEQAEIVTALEELLATEPAGEQGECPWCEAIRAPWAGVAMAGHRDWCPWARLGPLLERITAGE